jgi:predicted RecB family nuclease
MIIKVEDSDYMYGFTRVPRVTSILSKCIHSEELMSWANSLGFKHKNYKDILKQYASIGTQCHESIDKFLDTKHHVSTEIISREARNAFQSFDKWFNDINNHADLEVVYHEKTLTCKYFGGTLDGLYKINGKYYLIDYKTSNHVRFNYCLQLAAYRYMLRVVENREIDGCIILQLSKKFIGYNEYLLDFSRIQDKEFMDQCELAFMSLVLAYYNINKISERYNKLGWGK